MAFLIPAISESLCLPWLLFFSLSWSCANSMFLIPTVPNLFFFLLSLRNDDDLHMHSLCWRWRCFLSEDHQGTPAFWPLKTKVVPFRWPAMCSLYYFSIATVEVCIFVLYIALSGLHFYVSSLIFLCISLFHLLRFFTRFFFIWLRIPFLRMMFHFEVYIWVLKIIFLLFRYGCCV